MFTTNNSIVDSMLEINLSGNIIPQIWYKTLTDEKGRPQLLAINILADIVYWYRPTEMRDEGSGQLIGYRKKFAGDLLQRSYKQFEELFGMNTPAIRTALKFLESKNIVKRIFRTITVQGQTLNNVMFIELSSEWLKKVTFPQDETAEPSDTPSCKILQQGVQNFTAPVINNASTLVQNFATGIEENCRTNTKNITETITEIIPSINHTEYDPQNRTDRMMEPKNDPVILDPDEILSVETICHVRSELSQNKGIPYNYAFNPAKMKSAVQTLGCWNDHKITFKGDSLLIEAYHMVVANLIEMATSMQLNHYSGAAVSYKHVIDQINIIYNKADSTGGLSFFVERTAEKVKSALSSRKISHPDKFCKSLIWNNFRTYQIEWENYFHVSYYNRESYSC